MHWIFLSEWLSFHISFLSFWLRFRWWRDCFLFLWDWGCMLPPETSDRILRFFFHALFSSSFLDEKDWCVLIDYGGWDMFSFFLFMPEVVWMHRIEWRLLSSSSAFRALSLYEITRCCFAFLRILRLYRYRSCHHAFRVISITISMLLRKAMRALTIAPRVSSSFECVPFIDFFIDWVFSLPACPCWCLRRRVCACAVRRFTAAKRRKRRLPRKDAWWRRLTPVAWCSSSSVLPCCQRRAARPQVAARRAMSPLRAAQSCAAAQYRHGARPRRRQQRCCVAVCGGCLMRGGAGSSDVTQRCHRLCSHAAWCDVAQNIIFRDLRDALFRCLQWGVFILRFSFLHYFEFLPIIILYLPCRHFAFSSRAMLCWGTLHWWPSDDCHHFFSYYCD